MSRKHTTELFNIDGSATLTVDTDSGVRAHAIYIDGGRRCLWDVVPTQRAANIKATIDYLLKEKAAVSAKTLDGLTINRGMGNDRR